MPEERPTEESQQRRRAEIDRVLQRFHAGRSSQALAQVSPPERLFHYTSMVGLIGIASSGSIWATDARYLNDSSELTYATDLVDDEITAAVEGLRDEALRGLIPDYPGRANQFAHGVMHPFVACFCEKGDLLSQWRGYSIDESGVSLGFDLRHLAAFGHLPPGTYLRKVVYRESDQRASVRTAVADWLGTAKALLEEGLPEKELFPYPAMWALEQALAECHLCFKHPGFEEEHEWRLIKLVNVREELRLIEDRRREERLAAAYQQARLLGAEIPEPQSWPRPDAEGIDIQFRQTRMGLVPYVSLELHDRAGVFTGRLPLWDVIHGPSEHPELSLESLSLYLDSRGYGFHTTVRPSGVPLRS